MAKKISIKGTIVTNTVASFYQYLGWEASCPADVAKGLEEAAGADVILEINSNGGVATSGFEMYKLLMDYEGKVTAHVINAMSAASIVMCAADEVLASDAAIVMIHNTQCYAEGDYRDMQMEADALSEFNQSIINVYTRKTGRSREELQTMMDNDTHMSPEMAIENGFVDGYIYGDPNQSAEEKKQTVVVNASIPVITDEKAMEILALMKMDALNEGKDTGEISGSDKLKKGKEGTKNMSLEEILAEDEEAREELAAQISAAKEEGAKNERKRLEELDKLSGSVTEEALEKAKYGEDRVDARELAFQAMQDDKMRAAQYMTEAVEDSKESNVEKVGTSSDPEQEPEDESSEMASLVNKKRGGKKS